MEKQIDKIKDFIKTCESFKITISANGIWNLNDGVNVPLFIDKNTAEWRIFTKNVEVFFSNMKYDKWKTEFNCIVSNRSIDNECIDELRVFFSTVVSELESINEEVLVRNEQRVITPLKQLVEEISIIKSNFRETGGNGIPRTMIIYNNPMFLEWISKLQFELQQLKQDQFVKDILELAKSFNGWNDVRSFEELAAKVKILNDNISKYEAESLYEVRNGMSKQVVFISHKSVDKKYGLALVNLLRGIGLQRKQIVFTSDDDYGIPIGMNIFDYLRSQIGNGAYMIYLLSENYYESVPCLNEMGAAWIVQNDYTVIGVPGFNFNNPKFSEGAIDPRRIGFTLDNKKRLVEFKNIILDKFHLQIDEVDWNRILERHFESLLK